MTLASEVHACILWLVPSVFEKLACLYTTAHKIAMHNMLRAMCKSHHTSMQDTYVRNLEDNGNVHVSVFIHANAKAI